MRSLKSISIASLLLAALLPSPASGQASLRQGDNVQFVRGTTTSVVMNQAYENVRWKVTGVYYSDDRYEWCSIDLENARTRETAESDMPDEYVYSGTLELNDYDVAYNGGAGRYLLKADCYWAGTDQTTVWVRWATRTRVTRVEGLAPRVVVSASKFSDDGWTIARNASVALQKKTRTGWTTVARRKTDRTGAAVFRQPTGQWRATTIQTNQLAASTATLRR